MNAGERRKSGACGTGLALRHVMYESAALCQELHDFFFQSFA